MARGRAEWKRRLEPKTYLGAGLTRLEAAAPGLTRRLGYHALRGFPAGGLVDFAEARVPSRMAEAPYAAALGTLSVANVDKPTGQLGHPGHDGRPGGVSAFGPLPPRETRRVSAIAADVRIPGHTLRPVDGQTQRLLHLYGEGHVDWGWAYPAPCALRQVRVPGYAWALPAERNHFHLLVEHILPVVDLLLRRPEPFRRAPVSIIARQRPALLVAILGLLARFGIRAEFVLANPFTTFLPDRYLFCRPVAASVEHLYAYRPTLDLLRDAVPADASPPQRLYIPRTGTRLRRLAGEAALIARLEARGFRSFAAHAGNVAEQIARFLRAEAVVSVHGAALTNLVWSAPGTRVVELFPEDARKTTYLHMAALHDLTYACAVGGPEDARQNFGIAPDTVLRALG